MYISGKRPVFFEWRRCACILEEKGEDNEGDEG